MSINETAMLLSGQLVRNERGTFYFNQPGSWIDSEGWPVHEQLHRTDGPAATWNSGHTEWYVNGNLHRLDGPAVIYPDGYQEWWCNGRKHRTNGPAVIHNSGHEFWIGGVFIRVELLTRNNKSKNC